MTPVATGSSDRCSSTAPDVHAPQSPTGPFVRIEAGEAATCAIRTDNSVSCWGAWAIRP